MSILSEKLADAYLNARPKYPIDWFTKLAARTGQHKLAWDVGTGNGQAATGLAEYFEKVVATDINDAQLKRAVKHERISYHHTPTTMTDDQMVALIGGDNSVDLIVAAQAVHYFDLSPFYNIAKRVLRREGGLIAVWVYNDLIISPEVDSLMKRLVDSTFPFRTPIMNLAFDGYTTMPFPFEGFLRSWQPAMKAKERGVELVTEDLISKFEDAWGGDEDDVKDVFYKAHMIVGKLSASDIERHRKRFDPNCVVTTLKDGNNSAVIASVTAAAFAGVAAYCAYSARKNT
ncbi:hypothetical protein V5N11_009413 [Cardamine amara subsp. amara]|uniref:Methyltransferase type 11 domain-containing protein n=1 Tax=Cardamine amara subsp. amara TaxID=228776 RepID=A0ABD0ZEU9_CARAN